MPRNAKTWHPWRGAHPAPSIGPEAPAATLAVPWGGRSRRDFYVKWMQDAHVCGDRSSYSIVGLVSLSLSLLFLFNLFSLCLPFPCLTLSFHRPFLDSGRGDCATWFLQMPCLK